MSTSPWRPRQTRDVPFSPNSITPTSPKLPPMWKVRGSRRNGIWAKGDVTGLSRTCRGRHGEVGKVEFDLQLERRVCLLDQVDMNHAWNKGAEDAIVPDGMDLSSYYKSVEWDLLKVWAKKTKYFYPCCPEPYPDVTFFFKVIIILLLSWLSAGSRGESRTAPGGWQGTSRPTWAMSPPAGS